jgi:cytochrome P450
LLTSEGADHARARRLVAPAFSPRRLAGYTDDFARITRTHTGGWSDGALVDMHQEMASLTLKMVGQTLLGTDVSAEIPGVRAGLESSLRQFGDVGFARPGLGFWRHAGAGDPAPIGRDAAIHDLVEAIIDRRRRDRPGEGTDVISALLAAAAEPDGLSAAEVHDQVITLLMAGHETTANALSWALYLLGRHPDVQARLRSEVDLLDGRAPTFADLPALTYTRAVISEAIRLYPPAWLIGRTTTKDLRLGGWSVPAGSIVAVSPWLLHRDPRWFDQPDRFTPERWLGRRREALPRNAYLPFGTGARACIGEQFARAEAATVLAVLAQSWTVHPIAGAPVAIRYQVTLRPAGPLPMTVKARAR